MTLHYTMLLSWPELCLGERELFNWPFGDLSFQTRDVWGPETVASAQKGTTVRTVVVGPALAGFDPGGWRRRVAGLV